jgi:hypothetical protein
MDETDNQIYRSIALPIDITLKDGRAAQVVALNASEQVAEAPIEVPDGQVLTEAIYNIEGGQHGCTARLALDLSGNVAAQIVAAIG